MVLISFVVGGLAGVLLLPTVSDLVSLIWALTHPRAAGGTRDSRDSPTLLFLIPAHDEEKVIGDCVRSIVNMDYPAERRRVIVVADNCTDDTPRVASEAGAECFERRDTELPGKPRALEWALRRIELRSYESIVIVDADTIVEPAFASELTQRESLRSVALQAYCGVRNRRDTAVTRMSAVFATARYHFAYPLKEAARLNVPLMGNGMCFGSEVLEAHGWKAFSICEDWEMYGLLTAAGVRIEGAVRARVFAEEARSLSQSESQRKRWAAGRMTVLGKLAGPIARSSRISWRQKLDSFAELTHLGPAAHLGFVVILVAGIWFLEIPGAWWLGSLLLVSIGRVVAYTLMALGREPDPMRSLLAFAYLPFYAIWRVGVQISALGMLGERPWIKTERND